MERWQDPTGRLRYTDSGGSRLSPVVQVIVPPALAINGPPEDTMTHVARVLSPRGSVRCWL